MCRISRGKAGISMDQRPIGVFDSGVGGLTALRELRQLMPEETLIYFGDMARVPYGDRPRDVIVDFARQDVRFLRTFDLKAILIACGTVTTTSLEVLREENDLPIYGVVEPACRKAAEISKNGRIGLIATAASVRSGAYEKALGDARADAEMFAAACPKFVPLIEAGRFRPGDAELDAAVREYVGPLLEKGIDTLILGCTHYPMLTEVLRAFCGPDVALVSAGAESALALRDRLTAMDRLAERAEGGSWEFYVSGRE